MLLVTLVNALDEPVLQSLTISQLVMFLSISSNLKRYIQLVQPASHRSSTTPFHLPFSITSFLPEVTGMPTNSVSTCWRLLKEVTFGWQHNLTLVTLYPPTNACENIDCPRTTELRKVEARQIVLHTLDNGSQPAWAVHLYCLDCHRNYHINFYVCDGQRTYYPGLPTYLQVSEHHFVERRLAEMWTNQHLTGSCSGTNLALCSNSYTEHVWDAFVLLALLRDHATHSLLLVVPHVGLQKDRFQAAMQERNERIDTMASLRLLITSRHRFCKSHDHLHNVCAVNACERLVVEGRKTCGLPAHRTMEALSIAKGKSAFSLRERLQRHRVTSPNDTVGATSALAQEHVDDLEENDEWFTLGPDGVKHHYQRNEGCVGVPDDVTEEETCPTKSNEGNRKLKAQFGRRRTHNEQTLVRPCGVILARATFFGAEAVSNVLEFVKKVFSVPHAQKPEHFIYDTACDVKQQVEARGDEWWKGVGMCVDVWHLLNKHKTTHDYCQKNCNPDNYPELMNEDGTGWWFNTSVAEQINVWLGSYHAICREMLPVKFNFFLDEMIRLRNVTTIANIEAKGLRPGKLPVGLIQDEV
ncbi:hypothetical protein PAXINDRAFT_163619 [Paxillus involutus ATCC 200175]|uniref:CxC5 like cysteine cluster associated with KDZ domain-containing protein n=1 Tax=Paxillus involutus ATCC 200175 TaxID=664439 RepID=A0A0C9SVT4_PAXIN|nr:hypothetical protein PAXINDRAFT_163619 [Paxillus involutus ATCC 200175]